MLEDALAIVIDHASIAAALGLAAVAGAMAEKLRADYARRRWRVRNRGRWARTRGDKSLPLPSLQPVPGMAPVKITDAADQLRIVMSAEFASQPLLNRSEARVFRELDQIVLNCNPLWQVMAQVSLGEILRTKNQAAYGCINSKRADLLLVDEHCLPRHVVEYQGAGHHQGSAAARDAVKKEALRRAGIGYHEVIAGHTTPSELRRLIERLVDTPQSRQGPAETPTNAAVAPHSPIDPDPLPAAQSSR